MTAARTLVEKIWDDHVVAEDPGAPTVLAIDLHLIHEVTSPQAFEGLRLAGRKVRRPNLTVATADHNVPTTDRRLPIADPISKQQIDTLRDNCAEFGIRYFDLNDPQQGIVHVIGPELGLTQPGITIVCGDSHTSTHGAFGALAFGIGTSEVEHVLATQTLLQYKPKTLELRVDGRLPPGITAKEAKAHRALLLDLLRRQAEFIAMMKLLLPLEQRLGEHERAQRLQSRLALAKLGVRAMAFASRVLWEVGSGSYRGEEDIYRIAHAIAWTDYFDAGRTLRVDVSAIKSPLTSLNFVTLKIKDAVCDKMRRLSGRRPG